MNTPNEFDDFINKMKQLSAQKAKATKRDQTIAEMVAEGNRLLEEEEREKNSKKKPEPPKPQPDETTKLESTLGSISENPYIRARVQLLNKMTPEARKVIERIEKGELERNHVYDRFVHDVALLGDNLSNTKLK